MCDSKKLNVAIMLSIYDIENHSHRVSLMAEWRDIHPHPHASFLIPREHVLGQAYSGQSLSSLLSVTVKMEVDRRFVLPSVQPRTNIKP